MTIEGGYDARLFGIALELKPETTDELPNTIVRNEYPYKDGAQLENTGQKARTVKCTAAFLNDEYDRHQDLIDALTQKETGEFEHPKYGVMIGYAENVSIRHDAGKRKAEIDFTFVEDLIGSTETVIVEYDVKAPAEASFLQGLNDAIAKFNKDYMEDIATLGGLTTKIQDYTSAVNSLVSGFEAGMNAVANPANTLLSTVTFLTDLPGRVIGSIANVVERYSEAYSALHNAPARFTSSLKTGLAELETATGKKTASPKTQAQELAYATVMNHLKIQSALRLGLETAYRFKEDQPGRNTIKRNEKLRAFDGLGNYKALDQADPVMNADDLEKALADARELLRAALETDRSMTSLKNLAESLLRHVNIVKLEREKIVAVEVLSEMPLHVLCLQRGLPYQAAERILLINNFKNPNAIKGTVNVYAA